MEELLPTNVQRVRVKVSERLQTLPFENEPKSMIMSPTGTEGAARALKIKGTVWGKAQK